MKKSKRRFKFISLIILAIAVIAMVLAIATKKTNIYATDFTDTNGVTYTYTSASNKLTIGGSGTIGTAWKNNDTLKAHIGTITTVEIANTITGIEASAFEGCISLETVTFKESSSVTSIGDRAFSGCTALNDITIPDSVIEIADSAFEGCMELATLALDTEEIETVELNNNSSTASTTLTKEGETYTVPTSGKYKIELYGQRGLASSKNSDVSKRAATGGNGSYISGYMKLTKDDSLTTVLYESVDAVESHNWYGGKGGQGIGLKLNGSIVGVAGRRFRDVPNSMCRRI